MLGCAIPIEYSKECRWRKPTTQTPLNRRNFGYSAPDKLSRFRQPLKQLEQYSRHTTQSPHIVYVAVPDACQCSDIKASNAGASVVSIRRGDKGLDEFHIKNTPYNTDRPSRVAQLRAMFIFPSTVRVAACWRSCSRISATTFSPHIRPRQRAILSKGGLSSLQFLRPKKSWEPELGGDPTCTLILSLTLRTQK
jgi:hypothetical protein